MTLRAKKNASGVAYRCEIFVEAYRGVPVRVYWTRPSKGGALIYGYETVGEFSIETCGFPNSTAACRHAGAVIDELMAKGLNLFDIKSMLVQH